MNSTRALRLGLTLGLLVISTHGTAFAKGLPVAIKKSDLAHVVKSTSIDTIRAMEKGLSKAAFKAKLTSALRSPEGLKQTFPGLLGVLMKGLVGTKSLPGKIVPVGFDDHIENTGVVRIGKDDKGRMRSIQTIIDLDDAGLAPAGLEAVSIGTALMQAGFHQHILDKAFKAFASAATGAERGPLEVDGPKWGKLERKWIAKNTKADKRDGKETISFKHEDRAPAKEYDVIVDAAKRNPVLDGYELLDVATHSKIGGGSGGLVEYQVLARDRDTDETRVFLLKERTRPGASQLGIGQPTTGTRIARLEKGLWKDVPKDVFFYLHDVSLPGRKGAVDFLVRDKLAIVGNVAKNVKDKATAVQVASLYGREHAGQFGALRKKELAAWMKGSTSSVSDAYSTLRDKLRTELETWSDRGR